MPKSKKKNKKKGPTRKSGSQKQQRGIRTPPRPPYHALADPSWSDNGATQLIVACYRLLDVRDDWLAQGEARGVEAGLARGLFVDQRLTYIDTAEGVYPASTGDAIVTDPKLFRWPDLPKAPYLLVLSAFDDSGKFQSRNDALREIEELVGIINSIAGRNAGDAKVFELDVELPSGNYIGTAGPLVVGYYDSLDLSVDGIDQIVEGLRELTSLPRDDHTRVALSLRWFARGLRESGQDALISLWVAVETLAMPDETNVKPAVKDLGQIYGADTGTTANRFPLGRIQGLRSRILHNGEMVIVSSELNSYLVAVYRDLLFDTLGLAPRFWIDSFLNRSKFDVTKYLQSIEAKSK